jgi:hypothetical protein
VVRTLGSKLPRLQIPGFCDRIARMTEDSRLEPWDLNFPCFKPQHFIEVAPMTTALQICDRTIPATDIIPLLTRYRLMPQLMRELVIDGAIADITYTDDELANFRAQVEEAQHPEAEIDDEALIRAFKIQTFKRRKFGPHIRSTFLQRKAQLDQIIYSLLRTQDQGLAYELYFRIQENEQPFAAVATLYSEGPEARTAGLVGPVDLGSHNDEFARFLISQPVGQLTPPTRLAPWFIVLRVEEKIPARLDEAMEQRLLHDLFEEWLSQQVDAALPPA